MMGDVDGGLVIRGALTAAEAATQQSAVITPLRSILSLGVNPVGRGSWGKSLSGE